MNPVPVLFRFLPLVLLLGTAPPIWSQAPSESSAGMRKALTPSSSQLYLQGHLVLKEGKEKEASGDYAGAFFKFKDARDLFDAAAESDPSWNPEIVEYRRRKVREEMEVVRQLEIERRKAGGAPSPSGIVGNASIKDPADDPAAGPASGGNAPRNTSLVIEERFRGMQAQIDSLTQRNEEIVRKLGGQEEELRAARATILNSRNAEKALREKLADAQTKLETAAPSARRQNQALTKRVEQLESQLGEALDQLSEANNKTDTLLADLEKAYGEIKERTRERDELQKERDQMQALLAGGDGGKAPEKLKIIAENQRLKKELESAQATVAKLTAEKAVDQSEIVHLRGQLQDIQQQVALFHQESEEYREQIRALTERLDATNLRLAETGQGAVTEVEASLENKVLREIILQQMKQQAKREAARQNIMADLEREGVIDSMKNLGVETARIYRSLAEMASSPALTREQRGVLSSSGLDQFLLKNGVGQLMMAQDSKALQEEAGASGAPTGETRSKEELTPELKAYANAAEEQFSMGAFDEAENQYRKILLIEPMNVHALSNLGVVQVNKGDFEEAEKTIRKALAYFYDSAPAHYLLGIVYLQQNRSAEAAEEIETSLKLDPNNSNAHLTLGRIAWEQKKRREAEQHLKEAIALDPSNGYAHFNLAVLYATDEKFSLARQHYNLARRHGADRDPKLENMFGS